MDAKRGRRSIRASGTSCVCKTPGWLGDGSASSRRYCCVVAHSVIRLARSLHQAEAKRREDGCLGDIALDRNARAPECATRNRCHDVGNSSWPFTQGVAGLLVAKQSFGADVKRALGQVARVFFIPARHTGRCDACACRAESGASKTRGRSRGFPATTELADRVLPGRLQT